VLRASEKEPDGRERKGGGKGRGVRFAKRAMPVSNLKGRFAGSAGGSGGLAGRLGGGGCCCPLVSGFPVGVDGELSDFWLSLFFESLLEFGNIDEYNEKCRPVASGRPLDEAGFRAE
jgi:hypothetical protein